MNCYYFWIIIITIIIELLNIVYIEIIQSTWVTI